MKEPTIELKAPKTIKDLRIKHLEAFTDERFLKNGEDPDVKTIVAFDSKLLGLTEPFTYTVDFDILKKIYIHCMNLFVSYKIENPAEEITINGIEYELVNMKRPSAGWLIDIEGSDFENDPVRLACICYIPKGTLYGDIDEHENLLYPIDSRHSDFKEHFPMIDYLNLNAFFLRKFKQSMQSYILSTKIQNVFRRKRK